MGVALVGLWGGLGGALGWPWWSLGVALVEPWGGFRVALYSGVYAEYMPSIWLCGGFGWLYVLSRTREFPAGWRGCTQESGRRRVLPSAVIPPAPSGQSLPAQIYPPRARTGSACSGGWTFPTTGSG